MHRWSVGAVVVAVIAGVLSALAPAQTARAADLPASILDGGFIISDEAFFDSSTMTVAEVQAFLNERVPSCRATDGPTCLRHFTADLPAKAADKYCGSITAKKAASAAHIIVAASRACKVNPQVILTMLQKEQGLVTSTRPSDWSYRASMGMNCPDTAPCSAASAGFVNQVYLGARQQQVYAKNPDSYSYRAGRVNTIKWHPNSACGSSKVYIENQATANLYIYTPYRANIAALAAGYATGDSCSAYGNRNFYNYFVQWFAPDASPNATGAPARIDACTTPAGADVVAASGSRSTSVATTGRKAPTSACGSGTVPLAKGSTVTLVGTYGAWSSVRAGSSTVWIPSSSLVSEAPAAGSGACAVPPEASITKSSGTVRVTTASLNIRKAPSTACATGLSSVKSGESYTRDGIYGQWWRISVRGSQYWAHSDYLAVVTSTPAPSPTPPPTAAPQPTTPAPSTQYVSAPTHLRPSAGSAVLQQTLRRGQQVTTGAVSAEWTEVAFGSTKGWVVSSKLTPKNPGSETARTRLTTQSTAIRTTASATGKIVASVPKASRVSVEDSFGVWRAVSFGSTKGWIRENEVAALFTRTPMRVKDATVTVRSQSSATSRAYGTLKKGHPVSVFAARGAWRVIDYGSRSAWVPASSLTAAPASTTKTTTAALNLRAAPSTTAKVVVVLAKGTKVKVTESKGVWRKVTAGSRTGWVHGTYLR